MPNPVPVLIVSAEMLQHGHNVLALDGPNLSRCHLAVKERIFSVGLGRPSPMPGAHDVQRRRDDLSQSLAVPLLSERFSKAGSENPVPGGGHANLVWERGHPHRNGWWRSRKRPARDSVRPIARLEPQRGELIWLGFAGGITKI